MPGTDPTVSDPLRRAVEKPRPVSILLVDDDANNLLALESIL